MPNFDDFKLSVEALSGGKNTVKLDDIGMPSVMVVLPKMLTSELYTGATANVHPAFVLNSVEKAKVAISKYQNVVINNRAYSLPMQDPKTSITFDAALAACRQKGDLWGLTPFSLWGAIALGSKKNKTMPRGNNNYGADIDYPHERGIETYFDSGAGKTGRTATGSGPATWNHNWLPDGIADLNGNVWEWCAGMRLEMGEIQIIPYADCMLSTSDMSDGSSHWKAILQDGSLVAPGTAGTLKLDYVASKWTLCTAITSQVDSSRSSLFKDMALAAGVTCPQILKELALFPDGTDGSETYGNDNFYANNGAAGRFPARGGGWNGTSGAGVFHSNLNAPRSYSSNHIGFRSAFYGEL
jgi:hypothetical protein